MITKIRVNAAITRHMAQFFFERDGVSGGGFFIQSVTKDGRQYYEVVERYPDGGGTTAYETWGEALGAWNGLAADIVRQMDPDTLFSGPQVQQITGLSSPGVTVSAQRAKIKTSRLGHTSMYSRDDLVKILLRSTIEGKRPGGIASRKSLLRKAHREQPELVPARTWRLVAEHYGLDGKPRTLAELAKEEGLSRERIRQIIAVAVARLLDMRTPKHQRKVELKKELTARKHMSIEQLFGVDNEEHHEHNV